MPFKDINAVDSCVAILKENIRRDRIFSGYLFVGPDDIGKRDAAKAFAKAINCLALNLSEPCEECLSCRKIDRGSHPDVFRVAPKGLSGSIGIDEIRSVLKDANLKPYEARKKVFIIEAADAMNTAASNAFLKTLEEPPKDNVFILISRSEKALLSTIVSRCYIIRFSGGLPKLIEGALTKDFPRDFLFYSTREELKEKLESLITYFRDIALYKAVKEKALIFHLGRMDEIRRQSEKFTEEELKRLIEKIITLRSYVDYNVNPKLIVDVVINEINSTPGLSKQTSFIQPGSGITFGGLAMTESLNV